MAYTDAYINREPVRNGHMQHCLAKTLQAIEESIEPILHEFDAIVVSGLSGVIPGAIIAHKYNKQLVVIRKDDDVCHGIRIEGASYFPVGTPYIIFDDVMASGRTMQRILNAVEDVGHKLPLYVLLYRHYWVNISTNYGEIGGHHFNHNLYVLHIKKKRGGKL